MDYSKERSARFLPGAAQGLHEENRRLRKAQAAEAERRLAERAAFEA